MLNQENFSSDDLFAPISYGGGGGGEGGGGASNNSASSATAAMDGHFAANAAPAPGSANQATDTGWSACVIDRVNNQGDNMAYAGVVCAVEGMIGR